MAVSAPFGAAEYPYIRPLVRFAVLETYTYATGALVAEVELVSVGDGAI
jgi:hypothetical protein